MEQPRFKSWLRVTLGNILNLGLSYLSCKVEIGLTPWPPGDEEINVHKHLCKGGLTLVTFVRSLHEFPN